MNKVFAGAVLVGLISVAGCAVTPEGEAYMKYRAAQDAGQEALTGSRLIKPTTERMVGAVGNKEYNELNLHKGIANTVGGKSN